MKKISILLLFVLVMVFSAGCGSVTNPPEPEELDYEIFKKKMLYLMTLEQL
jgi:hypothetical protein